MQPPPPPSPPGGYGHEQARKGIHLSDNYAQ